MMQLEMKTEKKSTHSILIHGLIVSAVTIVSFLALFIAFILYVRFFFAGKAYPGVTTAGINVSGLSQPEIELKLGQELDYPFSGDLTLTFQNKAWHFAPAELGTIIDAPSMAQQAIAAGRSTNIITAVQEQLQIWYEGRDIPAIIIFDQRAGAQTLQSVAADVNRPVLEAALQIEGLLVHSEPGQSGYFLDTAAILAALEDPIHTLSNTTLPLVMIEIEPQVMDAGQTAEIAQQILTAPLALTVDDSTPISVPAEDVAGMLYFEIDSESTPAAYRLRLDATQLATRLIEAAPQLDQIAENARFIFNDDTYELDLMLPATIGRRLDVAGSLDTAEEALNAGQNSAQIAFIYEEPAVSDTATAIDLGITELVSMRSTYFGGSNAARIQNITTASSAFHGMLIAPGEVLSMADVLGEITLDNGYAEALIILGDETIEGVGGGVCQVSTTLFRTAFFGGYTIVERHPHAYRVGYYEQGPNSPGPGLDASVYVPIVDLKFLNDREDWLLMETYIYGSQLLWKFYSAADGRSVEISAPNITDRIDPEEPVYRENDELSKGKIKQVEWEAEGMYVEVYRTVTRDGTLIIEDIIKTRYQPWQAVYEFGPGTELPEDAKVVDTDD